MSEFVMTAVIKEQGLFLKLENLSLKINMHIKILQTSLLNNLFK